ncbi:hypothetical protein BGX28_010079 [Mortierella sp. GBA30]|nr:hypothetical protein BGX28_010079 [Mortierella sp. GBA30]
MVTTRSRGIKPVPGLDTATGQQAATTTAGVKRKNTATSSTTTPTKKKMVKNETDVSDLDSDLSAEAKLPPEPAPTPVIGNIMSKATVPDAPPLLEEEAATTSLSGLGQDPTPTTTSITATAATVAPAVAPVATSVATCNEKAAALEAVKEPAPALVPLPELETVLNEPVQRRLFAAATNFPSAPAPAASTASEGEKLSTILATAGKNDSSVPPPPATATTTSLMANAPVTASTKDPTIHPHRQQQQPFGFPIQTHVADPSGVAQPVQQYHNGDLSMSAGIDRAAAFADVLAAREEPRKREEHSTTSGSSGGVKEYSESHVH